MKKRNLLFFLMMLPLVASADAVEIDGIYYYLTAETKQAEVTKNPSKYSGSVLIPEKVTYESVEYSVTSIGNEAFHNSYGGLTSVTIPNSVTTIGYRAFYNCTGLTSIAIPNSVTSIVKEAFYHCSGLTSVTIPNSVTSIGDFAFDSCSGLTSITIGNSVKSIGDFAFDSCSGLTSITVEEGNSIYDSRDNCNAIIETGTNELVFGCQNTIIPNSVTSIGDCAFVGCSGLTSITIPNSVTSIGVQAFYHCFGLTSITIPNSVTSIEVGAFQACFGLTSIMVEESNSKYDSRDNCNAIIETDTNQLLFGCQNTIIPNSVTSIEISAFQECSGLTSVTIPNSVTSIGEVAFYECSGLTSVTIGNSVTSIGRSAFAGCSGLTSITIPNSVTSIGFSVFHGVDLQIVVSQIENPFTIDGKSTENIPTFSDNTFDNATLYVPVGTKEKYQATEGWKDFANIVEGTPTGVNAIKNSNNKSVTIFDLNGVRQLEPRKGINIINGKKIVVK